MVSQAISLPALVCGHMHRNVDTLHVGICRYIALLREAQGMTPEEASDNFQAIFRACSTDHEVCNTRPQPSKQLKHPRFKFIETHCCFYHAFPLPRTPAGSGEFACRGTGTCSQAYNSADGYCCQHDRSSVWLQRGKEGHIGVHNQQ